MISEMLKERDGRIRRILARSSILVRNVLWSKRPGLESPVLFERYGQGCVRFKKLEDLALAQDRHRRHSKRDHLRDQRHRIITLPDGRHLAVAAFVSDSAANDDTRDAIIARLAKAAWDRAQSR